MDKLEEIIEMPPTPPPPIISIDPSADFHDHYFRDASAQNSPILPKKFSEQLTSKRYETQISCNNFPKIYVKNFSNLGSELELGENIYENSGVLMLKVEPEELTQEITENQIFETIKNFSSKFRKNFLIKIKDANGSRRMFWKFNSIKIFYLKLLQKQAKISNFLLDFLATSLSANSHAGISLDTLGMLNSSDEIIELELLSLANLRDFNLLMVAAEVGDKDAVDLLLREGFDVNTIVCDKMAIDLAWENQHYDVVLELLKANSMYPAKFNFKEATNELKTFASIARELHNYIKSSKQHKIIEILMKNPNLRYFYTTKNISAPVKAVLCVKFEIYELLVSRNVFIGPKENINSVLKQFDDKTREKLRGINLKYLKTLTENHLLILMGNSFIGCDVPDLDDKFEHVKMAFKFLDQLHDSISLILKVVASSRDFKIIFDFHRECVQHLDPTSSSHTRGVYHSTRHIYIAAKQLFDPKRKLEAYGTLIHELCHFAMQLVYKNDCRPYKREEYQMFKEISEICAKKKGLEELIDLVYMNYCSSQQHAELISRVPHMMVEYAGNEVKLVNCQRNFPELINHFEEVTKVDMKNSLHNVEMETDQIIKSFQHRVMRKKRQIFWMWILSGFLVLSIPFAVWFSIWKYGNGNAVTYSCQNLTEENAPKIFNSTVNFQGLNVIFGDLFRNSCVMLSAEVVTSMMYSLKTKPTQNPYRNYPLSFAKDDKFEVILNISKVNMDSDYEKVNEKYQNLKFHGPLLTIGTGIDAPGDKFVERKFNLTNQNHSTKIFLLSDGAGSGKSTIFLNITWKLKQYFPLSWISFINLKLSDHLFMQPLNLTTDFEFLCEKIFKLTSALDVAAFKWKFSNNQSIFLWDDIDKLEESQMNQVIRLIDYIAKKSNNQQWISIRSDKEHLVSEKLNVSIYKLDSYNKEEREEFVKKFMATTNVTGKNISTAVNGIEKFVDRLIGVDVADIKLINSPQTLNMICTLYVRNHQLPNSSNLYEFFDYYVNDLYRFTVGQMKQVDVTENSMRNFRKIHQHYAIKEILPPQHVDMMDIAVYKNIWDNEFILKFRIMVEMPKGTLSFADRTIAEFFVAQYFNDNFWWVWKENKDKENFKIVKSFVNGFKKDEL